MNKNLESLIPLLNKNLKIIQRSDYFNFSIDSLLISEFVNLTKADTFMAGRLHSKTEPTDASK